MKTNQNNNIMCFLLCVRICFTTTYENKYLQTPLTYVVSFLVTNKPRETIREDLKGDFYLI